MSAALFPDTTEFEQALQQNLQAYIQPNAAPDQNFFQVVREISFARFALSNQASSYFRAITLLNTMLESVEQEFIANGSQYNPHLLTNIMQAIAAIESRSKSLISSVREVAALVKEGVNIDIDKSALRNLIAGLPSMIQSSVERVSGDAALATNISITLNQQINEVMSACRFDKDYLSGGSATSKEGQPLEKGIDINQYHLMFSSVPIQPDVVEPAKPLYESNVPVQ